MATLENRSVSETYKDLLQVSNSNSGIDTTARVVSDGEGTDSILYLSTGKVGVGRSPNTKFAVQTDTNKNINFSASSMGNIAGILARNDGNDTMVALGIAGSPIQFSIDGTNDAMRLDSTGLGIGATTIQQLLHLEKDDADVGIAFTQSGQRSWSFGIDNSDSDRLKIGYSTTIGSNTVATFTETGSLGIGCDHPSVPLEVELSGDTGTYFEGGGSGNDASDLRHLTITASTTTSAGDTHTLNAESGSGVLKFATSGSDRMIVNSTGVGIGASNPGAVIPNGYAGSNGMLEVRAGSSGADAGVLIRRFDNSGDGVYGMDLWTDTNQAYNYIDSRGNLDGANLYIRTKTAGTPINAIAIKGTGDIDYVGDANYNGSYIVNEQGRQNHVANTMSSPYYRTDGVDDFLSHTNITLLDVFTNNNDVSFEVLFKMPNTLNEQLFSYGISGSNFIQFFTIAGDLAYRTAGHGDSSLRHKVNQTLFEAGKIYHLAITMVAGSHPTIYVNGNAISFTPINQSSDDAISNSGLQIGRGQLSSPAYGEFEFYRFKAFNLALDATEVKELYSGASVPFKYKGSSQTSIINNGDFSNGATTGFYGGWSHDSSNNEADYDASGNDESQLSIQGAVAFIKGKEYQLVFTVANVSSGALKLKWFIGSDDEAIAQADYTNGTHTVLFTSPVSASANFTAKARNSGQGGASGSLTNVALTRAGAVYEYDGSSAGEKLWGDKSGNDKHLTVSGATLENAPYDAGTEYEEGLFSPTLITSGTGFTSVTYDGANGGKYVRVGNLVHVQGFLSTDAITVGSASGNIAIGGLPYALSSVSSGLQDGHASFTIGVSKSWAGENPTRAVADANTSQFGLYYQEHNADYGIVVVADVGTGTNNNIIYFSGTYRT